MNTIPKHSIHDCQDNSYGYEVGNHDVLPQKGMTPSSVFNRRAANTWSAPSLCQAPFLILDRMTRFNPDKPYKVDPFVTDEKTEAQRGAVSCWGHRLGRDRLTPAPRLLLPCCVAFRRAPETLETVKNKQGGRAG